MRLMLILCIGGFQPEWSISTMIRGFPTRMVYLYYISCLRYTILVGNPQYIMLEIHHSGREPSIHYHNDCCGEGVSVMVLYISVDCDYTGINMVTSCEMCVHALLM